ncbi:MAG: NAD-dependent epimerase/dehydratase family protein, partial [Myxococcota bacterium]
GTGWLGRALARVLPGPVVACSRHGRWPDAPPHVRVCALDITTDPLPALPIGAATTVVVAVAVGAGSRRGPEGDAVRRALYVEGTRRLLAALLPGVRTVFVGSTSALPDRDAWLDETCDEPPTTARGRTQRDAEAVVLGQHPHNLVLRMGGLYGPDRELQALYRNRAPDVVRPGDGMAPTNLIHREDAVAALVAAVARPALGGIVHVVADGHAARRHMYDRIAARTGQPAPRWERPPASTRPRGKRVSNLRMKLALGVRLRHPLPG